MGGAKRVLGLADVFAGAGATVRELRLRADVPATAGSLLRTNVASVVSWRVVPESLSWSPKAACDALESMSPDVVICSTARSFHPDFAERWPVVIDFIDRLSDSYRDRAAVNHGPKAVGFRALGARMARFEERSADLSVSRVAAGWADASDLGADWVPITTSAVDACAEWAGAEPDHDAVFFGNLSYAPNVEAVQRLSRIWPMVQSEIPTARLLLAGARPTDEVRTLATQGGWELQADFDRVEDVLSSARVALAPLTYASGMQTKVLEAAMFGVPQVISPAAFAGLDPAFPVDVARDDAHFVERVVRLLRSEEIRSVQGVRTRNHVLREYTSGRWVPWAESLLRR
jgi:hypothetical protein